MTGKNDIPFVRAARSRQWQEHFDPETNALFERAFGEEMRSLGLLLTVPP